MITSNTLESENEFEKSVFEISISNLGNVD